MLNVKANSSRFATVALLVLRFVDSIAWSPMHRSMPFAWLIGFMGNGDL